MAKCETASAATNEPVAALATIITAWNSLYAACRERIAELSER